MYLDGSGCLLKIKVPVHDCSYTAVFQYRFGYMPSPIWSSSLSVPAYYRLKTPVFGQEILMEFEQSATFTDVQDPLTLTGLVKNIRVLFNIYINLIN